MRHHSDLLKRLRRLEGRLRERRILRVVMRVFDQTDDQVIGVFGDKDGARVTVLRQPGEALDALEARAFAMIGGSFLGTLYAASERPEPAHTRAHVPEASETPPAANLSGIGRRATRAELERMGVIPVPPERPV